MTVPLHTTVTTQATLYDFSSQAMPHLHSTVAIEQRDFYYGISWCPAEVSSSVMDGCTALTK